MAFSFVPYASSRDARIGCDGVAVSGWQLPTLEERKGVPCVSAMPPEMLPSSPTRRPLVQVGMEVCPPPSTEEE